MQVASSQIEPGQSFDLWYFIKNHLDATTYYVRAKIYDLRTGEVLDTVNLDQSSTNAHLFLKSVQAPPDYGAGTGRNIVAIATVYTDSGYTTKSDTYEEQEYYFLIKAPLPFFGGGGIDYRVVREIVEEAIDGRLAALPKPQPLPDLPFEALFGAIGALQREVNRIPKDLVDTQALSDGLDSIKSSIETLPQPEKPDLSGIVRITTDILTGISQLRDFIQKVGAAISSADERIIKEMGKTILAEVETGLKDLMSRQELTIPLNSLMKDKQPTPSPIDVSHLM